MTPPVFQFRSTGAVCVTVGKSSLGHMLRQGLPELRWVVFEASKCVVQRSSPDYDYYQ